MPFKKGESGNPGGRARGFGEWRRLPTTQKLRGQAYDLLRDAVETGYLLYILPDGGKEYERVDPKERIVAARELIDRIDGKPVQAITGEDGGAIKIDASTELFEKIRRLADDAEGGK